MRTDLWRQIVARRVVSSGGAYGRAVAEAGVSMASVRRWVADAGGMPIRRKLDDEKSCGARLCEADREQIAIGVGRRESDATIGARIGFHRTTVWREISRNGGRANYRGWWAQRLTDERACRPKQSWFQTHPEAWVLVQEWLKKWWSPEQISARLKVDYRDDPEMWVSAETIYRSIYVQTKGQLRKDLAACLRSGRARRMPRTPRERAKRGKIIDMVMISERPAEIEDRAVPGHWEGDLIMGAGGHSQVASLVERSTRFGILVALDSKDSVHVAQRLAQAASRIPQHLRLSLTWDQGSELAAHANLAAAADMEVYFCDPHSPWQRGTNENWNRLVRQYLPKGTDLSKHSQADLDQIAYSLNDRPRQTLQWMKPSEKLDELVALAA